jgi:SOS response regulatory protein OraA/RecX
VFGRLKSHRHLDDAALASDQAFLLIEGKGLSPQAAVQTLVGRGISEPVAREAVEAAQEGRSELELATQALARRLKGRALSPDAEGREARALGRAGYDEDVVARVIERARRTE